MKKKNILSTALLVFIGAALILVSVNATSSENSKDKTNSGESEEKVSNGKLTVYYFHGNRRCRTCKNIEKYTKEAVKNGFPEKMDNNKININIVNVDKDVNKHYIKDYKLTTKTVVLSLKNSSGEEKDWKRLDDTWNLVGNKEKFISYIQEKVKSFLPGGSK